MKIYHLTIISLLFLNVELLTAQETQPSPVMNQYYQIFLDEPVQKVNKVDYFDDSGAIEFQLSPDGRAIYLLDYKDEGGVKAEVIDITGKVIEVIRSKCKIHSLQEL